MPQFLQIHRMAFLFSLEMAKAAVIVAAAVVFLFVAVSPAHFQEVDLSEHDAVATVKTMSASSEHDIPSVDIRSEPANLEFNFNTEDTESKTQISGEESGPDGHTVPLTLINSRPIDLHFPRRPLIPLRHRHRLNCRHGRRVMPWDLRLQSKGIPFGDDMVTSDDGMNIDTVLRSRIRSVTKAPGRWVRFHRRHEGPRVIFSDEANFRGPRHSNQYEYNERREREHQHPHRDRENHRHKEEREEVAEEQKGGFLKSFRKFLNHF